jgi:hypothetical protein
MSGNDDFFVGTNIAQTGRSPMARFNLIEGESLTWRIEPAIKEQPEAPVQLEQPAQPE